MKTIKLYKDSKELPLARYERIKSTGDFLYLVKSYDGYDDDGLLAKVDLKELEAHYDNIVRDYVIELDEKSIDFVAYGKMHSSILEMNRLIEATKIVDLVFRANEVRAQLGQEPDTSMLDRVFNNIQIQRSEDHEEQIQILSDRIEKFENDIATEKAKIDKRNSTEKTTPEKDVNELISDVELVLEQPINMDNVSLFRFGVKLKQAKRRIDEQLKASQKYK